MISYIDGNVYIQVPSDAVDTLAVACLKEGREIAEQALSTTLSRIIEVGEMPQLVTDFTDNLKYLAAFNTLLEYYGAK